jgi:hypothetical protein
MAPLAGTGEFLTTRTSSKNAVTGGVIAFPVPPRAATAAVDTSCSHARGRVAN